MRPFLMKQLKPAALLACRVGDQGRDGQPHLRARSPFAPEIQSGSDSFRPFANSRQPPVAVTPTCLKDFRVDALSVIADMDAKQAALVPNLSFDLTCLCVPESIEQHWAVENHSCFGIAGRTNHPVGPRAR